MAGLRVAKIRTQAQTDRCTSDWRIHGDVPAIALRLPHVVGHFIDCMKWVSDPRLSDASRTCDRASPTGTIRFALRRLLNRNKNVRPKVDCHGMANGVCGQCCDTQSTDLSDLGTLNLASDEV